MRSQPYVKPASPSGMADASAKRDSHPVQRQRRASDVESAYGGRSRGFRAARRGLGTTDLPALRAHDRRRAPGGGPEAGSFQTHFRQAQGVSDPIQVLDLAL